MDFRHVDKKTVSSNLLRFAKYCDGLAGGAELPHRDAFAIGDVHWLFGFIVTADVLEDGRDYRYATAGDFWKVAMNFDLSNTRLSELEACGRLTNVRPNYDAARQARAPRYRTARLTWPDRKFIRYERLVVPFAGDDGAVSMLVVAAQCDKSFEELLAYKGTGEPRLVLELSAETAVA